MISVKVRMGDELRRFPLPDSLSALRESVWKRCDAAPESAVLTLLAESGDTVSTQEQLDALTTAAKTTQSHCVRLVALIEHVDPPGSSENTGPWPAAPTLQQQEQAPPLYPVLGPSGLSTYPSSNPASIPAPSPATPPSLLRPRDQSLLPASSERPFSSFDDMSVDLDLTQSIVSVAASKPSSELPEDAVEQETVLVPDAPATVVDQGASSSRAALDPLYVSLKHVPLDEALRIYLTRTFLPKNPSTRAAVLSVFGREYMDQNPDLFPSLQCVIGVSERLLWLSERLHDPALRDTVNRGVFLMEATLDGDFPIDVEPLADMYQRIEASPLLFLKPDEDELRLDEAATSGDAQAAQHAAFQQQEAAPVPSESAYTDSECESMIIINGDRVPKIADGVDSVPLGDDRSAVEALEASFMTASVAPSAAGAADGANEVDVLTRAFDLDRSMMPVTSATQAAVVEPEGAVKEEAQEPQQPRVPAADSLEGNSSNAPPAVVHGEAAGEPSPSCEGPSRPGSSCGSVFDPEIEFKEAERPPQPYKPSPEGEAEVTGQVEEPEDQYEELTAWKCLYCTFENRPEHLQCNVCFSERPHRPHQLVEQARQRHLLQRRRDPLDGTICGAVRDLGSKVRKHVHRTLSNLDEFVAKRKPSWTFGDRSPPAPAAPAHPPVKEQQQAHISGENDASPSPSASASSRAPVSVEDETCAAAAASSSRAAASDPTGAAGASDAPCREEASPAAARSPLGSSLAGCVDDERPSRMSLPAPAAGASSSSDAPPLLERIPSAASSECSGLLSRSGSLDSSSVFVEHSEASFAAAEPEVQLQGDRERVASPVAVAVADDAETERVKDDIIARMAQRLDALEQQNQLLLDQNAALKRKVDANAAFVALTQRLAQDRRTQ